MLKLKGLARLFSAMLFSLIIPFQAWATPSTTFWAPSTPAVQAPSVLHITYDTYFQPGAAYPVDFGLEFGTALTKRLNFEAGFDILYPTMTAGQALNLPLSLNAKIGGPEGSLFSGSPAWSAGIFGVGLEHGVTNYNLIHVMVGRTSPRFGSFSAGGYYGLTPNLLRSASGETQRSGILAGWTSPDLHFASFEKVNLAWDLQSGRNVFGATGGGLYFYLAPSTSFLVGPVLFMDPDLQPGRSRWMWTIQFDTDINLRH